MFKKFKDIIKNIDRNLFLDFDRFSYQAEGLETFKPALQQKEENFSNLQSEDITQEKIYSIVEKLHNQMFSNLK